MQNAGALSHARHLLRGANARAKSYYQLTFVEENMMDEDVEEEDEEEEENLESIRKVKEKTSGKWDERRKKRIWRVYERSKRRQVGS